MNKEENNPSAPVLVDPRNIKLAGLCRYPIEFEVFVSYHDYLLAGESTTSMQGAFAHAMRGLRNSDGLRNTRAAQAIRMIDPRDLELIKAGSDPDSGFSVVEIRYKGQKVRASSLSCANASIFDLFDEAMDYLATQEIV